MELYDIKTSRFIMLINYNSYLADDMSQYMEKDVPLNDKMKVNLGIKHVFYTHKCITLFPVFHQMSWREIWNCKYKKYNE
jgi:hypothetical protein